MDREALERKLAAILTGDLKGFTRLVAEDELLALQDVRDFRALVRERVEAAKGTLLETSGDGFLSLAEAGFTYLAELKPYDKNGDGQLSLSDLLALTMEMYVDFGYVGTENGTVAEPFDTLLEAVTFVANGGTVNIATGTSSETILINKDVDLIATAGTVTIGTP